MRELGAALGEHARVDLSNPEIEVHVEIRDERAVLYSTREPGAGGLPLGVEGRAVCLLSGGFDSAVAAWMMLRRGVPLDYLFCNLGGSEHERSALLVANLIARAWSYGTQPVIHVLDFRDVAAEIQRRAERAFWQVVLKRQMARAAEQIAVDAGASAIVSGESANSSNRPRTFSRITRSNAHTSSRRSIHSIANVSTPIIWIII